MLSTALGSRDSAGAQKGSELCLPGTCWCRQVGSKSMNTVYAISDGGKQNRESQLELGRPRLRLKLMFKIGQVLEGRHPWTGDLSKDLKELQVEFERERARSWWRDGVSRKVADEGHKAVWWRQGVEGARPAKGSCRRVWRAASREPYSTRNIATAMWSTRLLGKENCNSGNTDEEGACTFLSCGVSEK